VPGLPVYYAPSVNSNFFFYDGMYWVYAAPQQLGRQHAPRSSTASPNMGDKRRGGKVFDLLGSLPNIRLGVTRCVWLRRAPGPPVLDAEGGESLGIHPACDSKPLLSLKGA
jgi:hypothetical protein